MNSMQSLEKRLAELLGWTDTYLYFHQGGGVRGTCPERQDERDVPRWTADNGAAFELMCEHSLEIIQYVDGVSARSRHATYEMYKNHPTKQEAVRMAIVKAVIAELEASKGAGQ